MHRFVRIGDRAGYLRLFDAIGHVRKRNRNIIPRLFGGLRVVDGTTIESWWCAGLEAVDAEAESSKRAADAGRCPLPGASTGCLGFSGVHDCL